MSETSAPGFTRIDNRIITLYGHRIGPNALAVYVALGYHANNQTRQCYPSTRTLAALLHLGRPTVLKALRTLEDVGLISVERSRTAEGERRVNVYTLLPIGGGQAALPPVVNDVDHRGKAALPELDLINKTQENKREGASAGRASAGRTPTPAPPRDPNLDHPAVKAYRDIFELTPNEIQRAEIAQVVTDVSTCSRCWGTGGLPATASGTSPACSTGTGKKCVKGATVMAGIRAVGDLVSKVTGAASNDALDLWAHPRNSPYATPSGKRLSGNPKQGVQTVIHDVALMRGQGEMGCPVCKGRGFVMRDVFYGHPEFGKALHCPKCGQDQRPQLLASECGLPKKLRPWTFDKVMRHAGNAQAYEAALARARKPCEFLTLIGPTGVGKSVLLAATINEALSRDFQAYYTTTADLLDYLRVTFKKAEADYDARWERLKSVRVLCIDELDRFNPTDWALEKFFQLISARYDNGDDRLTCFATNASIDTFPAYLQSRMRDRHCCMFELTGIDVWLCDPVGRPQVAPTRCEEGRNRWRGRAIRRGGAQGLGGRAARGG
jgi:DNA-binding MarR family transcriptional regulator